MQHAESLAEGPTAPAVVEFRLTDILAHHSRVLWHEAVGLVLGIAEVTLAADPAAVPSADAIYLATDGTLRVDEDGTAGTDPVTQLRAWLRQLLQDTPTPPPLADLAHASDTQDSTVAAFVEKLAYFSRPNRQDELAVMARRVLAERQVAPIERELAALTAKITRPEAADREPKRRGAIPRLWTLVTAMGRSRVALIAIAASATILTLAFPTTVRRAWVGPAPLPAETPWPADLGAPRVETSEPEAPGAGTAPVSLQRRTASVNGTASATPGARRQGPASRSSAAPGPPRPGDVTQAPAFDAIPVRPSFSDSMPGTRVAAETAPEPAVPAPPVAPTPARIFTPDDADVVQPVLLSSSVPAPSVPGASESGGITVVDLLIDEHGRVDRAALVSPAARFEERMLLSAVKAWRFRPATKDGVPVKYRARISLTF